MLVNLGLVRAQLNLCRNSTNGRVDLVSEKRVWNKCIFLYESFNIRREIQLIAIDLYTWLFVGSVPACFTRRWKQRRRRERERNTLCEDAGQVRRSIFQNMVWIWAEHGLTSGWQARVPALSRTLLGDTGKFEASVSTPVKGKRSFLPHGLWGRLNQSAQKMGWGQCLSGCQCSINYC